MAKIKTGITRKVIILGKYAFKIANFQYGHIHFIEGCLSNLKERYYFKKFSNSAFPDNMVGYVAPSVYCSVFGILQIQKKCEENTMELSADQKRFFMPLCGSDNKPGNFGFFNGKLVCLDYN